MQYHVSPLSTTLATRPATYHVGTGVAGTMLLPALVASYDCGDAVDDGGCDLSAGSGECLLDQGDHG